MNNKGRQLFILISFILILGLSLFNASTSPITYSVRDVDNWGPVVWVGLFVTIAAIFWLYRLWNVVIPNIENWKRLSWNDFVGMVTMLLIAKHLLP